MSAAHERYLEAREAQAADVPTAKVILWPDTPIDAIQDEIEHTTGVRDNASDERSRAYRIIEYLQPLDDGTEKSVLDICCGDGLILYDIAHAFCRVTEVPFGNMEFPGWDCYGIDIQKGEIDTHAMLENAGIRLYRTFIQELFATESPERFDVALMLNTYRGWVPQAQLRRHERNLPQMADAWLVANTKLAILTALPIQVKRWQGRGYEVKDLGRGEQKSRLIAIEMKA